MKTTMYGGDIQGIFVHNKNIHVIYCTPTEQAMFSKEDLEYMRWLLDDE